MFRQVHPAFHVNARRQVVKFTHFVIVDAVSAILFCRSFFVPYRHTFNSHAFCAPCILFSGRVIAGGFCRSRLSVYLLRIPYSMSVNTSCRFLLLPRKNILSLREGEEDSMRRFSLSIFPPKLAPITIAIEVPDYPRLRNAVEYIRRHDRFKTPFA